MRPLALNWNNGWSWLQRIRRSGWTLPLAVAAAALVTGINHFTYQRATVELQSLAQRDQTELRVQEIWRALIEAETAQRAYLITAEVTDLKPYWRAREEVLQMTDALAARYEGEADASHAVASLREAALNKLSELHTTLELHQNGSTGVWRELMLTDIGREKMEQLRLASAHMLEIEKSRMSETRAQVLTTLAHKRWGIALLTVAALIALLGFMRQRLRFEQSRSRQVSALQAQRDQLQLDIQKRTADLSSLARHLQDAREEERGRLARELHDELGALLTATKFDAARLRRTMSEATSQQQQRLEALGASIDEGIRIKRRLIEELRPSSLDNLGLASALQSLADDFARRHAIAVDVDVEDMTVQDPAAGLTLYRVAQSALANVAQHAAASHVVLRCRMARPTAVDDQTDLPASHAPVPDAPLIELSVDDDGIGFDPGLRPQSSHGLLEMRYRAESHGGRLTVRTAPGEGTRIAAWLPLRSAGADAESGPDQSGTGRASDL